MKNIFLVIIYLVLLFVFPPFTVTISIIYAIYWFFFKNNIKEKNRTYSKEKFQINNHEDLSSQHNQVNEEYLNAKVFELDQYKRILTDSLSLIETSSKPETFFSRYKLCIDHLKKSLNILDEISPYLSHNENNIEEIYNDLIVNKKKYFDDFINRSFDALEEKFFTLKTEKGKINSADKWLSELMERKNLFSPEQVTTIKNKYSRILGSINCDYTPEVNFSVADSQIDEKQNDIANNLPSIKDSSELTDIWNISISFGHSSSKNLPKAVYLAKNADYYLETKDENDNLIYQGFYLKENYLEFQRLYKLIGNWKSTFIFINGELIDNKSLGKINICYGDKLKFNNPHFCYGASFWTSNPFGCHRLMITPSQTPWWSFGSFDKNGDWIINKEDIKEKIMYKSKLFMKCPAFNLQKALFTLDKIPNKIYKYDKNWLFTENGVELYNDEVERLLIDFSE